MRIKRKLILLGLLSAVFLISGCDNNKNNDDNSNSNTNQQTEYLVNFNVGLGNTIMPTLVKSGQKVQRPSTTPTRNDSYNETYTFAGWYKDEACTVPFDFDTEIITGPTTIYVKWDSAPRMFTVTFNTLGGSEVNAINATYGSKITKPTDPSKISTSASTYTFVGWYKDTTLQQAFDFDNDTITEAITLYAKWDTAPVEYIVTFDTNGGSAVDSQTIAYGSKASRPTDPTKAATESTKYSFAGWYKDAGLQTAFDFDNDIITGPTTIYAKWNQSDKVSVVFNSEGGTPVETQFVFAGEKVTRPDDPTKATTAAASYEFAGWYEDAGLQTEFDFDEPIQDSTTIYAKWDATPIEYTITFNSNGGSPVATRTLAYGSKLEKPNDPTKTPDDDYTYTFAGWYKDSGLNSVFDFDNDTITGTTTLYAKWTATPITYITITYRMGSFSDNEVIGTQSIVQSNDLLYPQLEAPEVAGYRFVKFMMKNQSGEYELSNYANKLQANANRDIFAEYEFIDMNSIYNVIAGESELTGLDYLETGSTEQQSNFYQSGYVTGKISDFSQYENTTAYVKVYNADQLIQALENARLDYTSNYVLHTSTTLTAEEESALATLLSAREQLIADNKTTLTSISGNYTEDQLVLDLNELNDNRNNNTSTWKNENPFRMSLEAYVNHYVETTLDQTLNSGQTVHVIEIMNDIDLGYYKLSATAKASSIVSSYSSKYDTQIANGSAGFYVSSMLSEYGISSITISKTNDLLVYSKNGAKLTHGGFKISSCDRVVFRNLEMDEIWQWEDSASSSPSFTVGDMDVFGWKYFDIKFCGYIWIDHCTFGKAYDGIIDISNPYFYSYGTASSAPYGKPSEYTEDDSSGIHISNCYFRSGTDDPDGYLYKMMEEIEADYQLWVADNSYQCKCLYYKALRSNRGLSFEEILYGIAIPHKKAFLWGDSSESKKAATYHYNQYLKVSFANNVILDIEDRLPNVRGGIAYIYNTVIDNSRYYKYRQILIEKGAKNISSVNSKYKLALVSQGILGGYGASIYAENCIFIGIESLVKNNNKEYDDITTSQMAAGFNLVNCVWYNDAESTDYTRIINTIDNPNQITTSGDYPITVANFSWHNESGQKPFNPALYDTSNLTKLLLENQNVGVNSNYADLYLITSAE